MKQRRERDFVFIESREKVNDDLEKGCLGAMTDEIVLCHERFQENVKASGHEHTCQFGGCTTAEATTPSLVTGLLQYVAEVLLRLQPAVFRIVFEGILLAALLVDVAHVECGVKMDVSTPESSRAALTQRLIVSLDTFLCGFF